MEPSPAFFLERLYPLQDDVLARVRDLTTDFYLSGGTAASRAYLQHRFSDDLDLFTNDAPEFPLWADRVIEALRRRPGGTVSVALRERRFVRCVLETPDVALKIEMVDDVPSRVGSPREHAVLGRIDSAENILANKLTALVDRREPKDLADVWGFCCRMKLSSMTRWREHKAKRSGCSRRTLRGGSSRRPVKTGRWCAGLMPRMSRRGSPSFGHSGRDRCFPKAEPHASVGGDG